MISRNGTPNALRIGKEEEKNKRGRKGKDGRPDVPSEEEFLFEIKVTTEGERHCAISRFRETNLPGFDRFWAAYPVRREKPQTLRAWKEFQCEAFADAILAKVDLLKREDDHWLHGFVKWPARWLRAEGWNDKPAAAPVWQQRQSADERQLEAIRRSDITFAKMMEGFDERRRG